jgi:hypothetical protein
MVFIGAHIPRHTAKVTIDYSWFFYPVPDLFVVAFHPVIRRLHKQLYLGHVAITIGNE